MFRLSQGYSKRQTTKTTHIKQTVTAQIRDLLINMKYKAMIIYMMHALGIYTYVYIHVYDQKETIYRIYIFQEIVQGYIYIYNIYI